MLGVYSAPTPFPPHNRSSARSPTARQWAGSRAPLLLVAVGRSAQSPAPCRMFKVPSGRPPAPACSPLALTFLHRRRLRLLGPSLSLLEPGAPPAPAAPAGPAPRADSISSPGTRRRDQFQPPGPAPRANPGHTAPPGPQATQSRPRSPSGPAPWAMRASLPRQAAPPTPAPAAWPRPRGRVKAPEAHGGAAGGRRKALPGGGVAVLSHAALQPRPPTHRPT